MSDKIRKEFQAWLDGIIAERFRSEGEMSKPKWAPWSYAGGGVIHGSDGKMVAYLAGRMNDGSADQAARLMAAAPEMYEALKAVLDEQDENPTGLGALAAHNSARKVLAKARGEI